MRARLPWVLIAVAALAGCDRAGGAAGAPGAPDEDRTLQRLQQEAIRQQEQVTRVERLANAAVTPQAETRKALPAPKQPRAVMGPLQLEVVALTVSHVVEGQRVSVATEDRFLRVQVAVKNAGKAAATADFAQAALVGVDQRTWGIARDAQRLAGTPALRSALAPGESRDFVMFFEVPEAALGGELVLSVSGAGAGRNGDGVISLD